MYRAIESFPRGSGLVHAGTEIDLTEDEADELIAGGLIEPLDPGSRAGPLPVVTSAQIARLRELTPEQLDAALAPPQEQTVPDIFHEMCGAVFSRSPEDRAEFIELLRTHSAIGPALAPKATAEDAIAGAIAVLKIGRDPASWMASGAPTVSALEAALGFDVSAAQRDAAWEASEAESGGETPEG